MIEKITEDKFLYQGRIVDLAFLQARKAELESLIEVNEAAIKDIKLIELIPEIEGNEQYREAAELYNEKEKEKEVILTDVNIAIKADLSKINSIL